MQVKNGRSSARYSSPQPLPPPAPVQAGQQTQQQQQKQGHVASQVHASAGQQPGQQLVLLTWSYFKPKPDEGAEAPLLHTNDWMKTHHFSRCQSPNILFNTIRRSLFMVSFTRIY